jgi:OFA family oxalate/formate antiporter-like MFS transporter
VITFVLLPSISDFTLLVIVASVVGLCYGGGFGTMPAFATDFFGPKNSGTIYGVMLTAWSAGAIIGPLLITSFSTGKQLDYGTPLYIIAVIMLVSTTLPLVARTLSRRQAAVEVVAG